MNRFLKDKENKYFEEKQKWIRETLSYHLSENVKENEYEFKARNEDKIGFCEATSTLCYTLEAIFLHGLKDSFLQILSNFGSDEYQKPNPSFWTFVSKFLHQEDINDISQGLSQLSTEIGYCRAFIRKALNESLTSSYLQNIRKSGSTLKGHYHPYAFFFDSELIETAETLLRGIESYVVYDLPYNSSLLNVWNDTPLQLSGIYTAPLKHLPPQIGEDVAGLMISTTSRNIDIPPQRNNVLSDIYTASISNSIFSNSSNSALDYDDENEGMARLLRDDTATDLSEKMCESVDEDILTDKTDDEKMQESQDATPENVIGNSLQIGRNFWAEPSTSSDIKEEGTKDVLEDTKESQPAEVVYSRTLSTRSGIDNHSFESLWNEKQRKSTENFRDVWNRFQKTMISQNQDIPEEEEIPGDFEVVRAESDKLDELQHMVEVLCRLNTESGLDHQGFLCKDCKSPLVDISKATVCGFDGYYYCTSCISKDKYAIPSKIIYNWDFTQYCVSKKAADFIYDYQFKPIIDFKILNPDIYSYIDEMNNLQKLRIQLNFIRAYIFTCSESTIGELQKLLYGKEYIYESIHLYSVADLFLIQNGALQDMLKKVVNFGREHCMKCVLCSVKGFICEYCRRSKIIYPFEVDETMRCNACGTISHINCYNPLMPCPKCERKRKRHIVTMLQSPE